MLFLLMACDAGFHSREVIIEKMKCLLFLVMLSIVSEVGNAQNTCKYFEQLPERKISIDDKDIRAFADSVYIMGKEAIPLLINDIDRKEKLFIGFGKRHLSTFPPVYWSDNYRGIRSAYFIEYIMRRDSIYKHNKKSLDKFMSDSEAKEMVLGNLFYYLGNSNVIAKNDNNKPLTYEDMQKVKVIYERWWRANRHKSIDELRKESWRKPILRESPYHWM